MQINGNGYVRTAENFADDDQLLDSGISFPIAFRKAFLYGAEGSVTLRPWHRLSGFGSYSYLVGSASLPVTGGLFLGDNASVALAQTGRRIWVSQDQRHTVRTRFRYQLGSRIWAAGGAAYDSGLPIEFDGDYGQAVSQYGTALVGRVNFDRNRVRPAFSLNTSAGIDLIEAKTSRLSLDATGSNLNNRLNLIDFAGLFSVNALAPTAKLEPSAALQLLNDERIDYAIGS